METDPEEDINLHSHQPDLDIPDHASILFDGMAVVHEIVFKDAINKKNCKDLVDHLIRSIGSKGQGYASIFVVFDNRVKSLKRSTKDHRSQGASTQCGGQHTHQGC